MASPEEVIDAVFVFSDETWADAERREMGRPPDRLLQSLLGHPRIRRALVVNPYRSWVVRSVRALLGHRDAEFPASPRQRLLQPYRTRRRDPARLSSLRRWYRRYDNIIESAAQKFELRAPIVVTVNPFVAGLCRLEWASRVTYWARDDWSAYPPYQHRRDAVEAAYEGLQQHRRGVSAVSSVLLERLAPTGRSAVIPNGVDAKEWERPHSPPPWFDALPRPRILYSGTVDSRLDADAVADVARHFPDGAVILLGLLTESAVAERLQSLENVILRPSAPRAEVVSVTHAADVCMVPHVRTRLTEAMSPIKLYEYLAGGSPVAVSDLPPMRDVDQRVVVNTGEPFGKTVAKALGLGHQNEAGRLEFVRENSWDRRFAQFWDLAL